MSDWRQQHRWLTFGTVRPIGEALVTNSHNCNRAYTCVGRGVDLGWSLWRSLVSSVAEPIIEITVELCSSYTVWRESECARPTTETTIHRKIYPIPGNEARRARAYYFKITDSTPSRGACRLPCSLPEMYV